MDERVRIESDPVSQEWNSVNKIEVATPGSGSKARIATRAAAARCAGKAGPKVTKGKRFESCATEYGVARETNFEILGRVKADLVSIEHRARRIVIARELSDEIV